MVAVSVLNIGFFFASQLIINRAADKVIERLQKEYCPSPYGPGLDPDKVNPQALKNQKVSFQFRNDVQENNWKQNWEQTRGFSPKQ